MESVIDIVRTTSEAAVAAVFKETSADTTDGPQHWSVSLRSRNGIDVSKLATGLGGGGHRNAAGYTTAGPVEAVIADLRAALG